jgi:hypothetical protein
MNGNPAPSAEKRFRLQRWAFPVAVLASILVGREIFPDSLLKRTCLGVLICFLVFLLFGAIRFKKPQGQSNID